MYISHGLKENVKPLRQDNQYTDRDLKTGTSKYEVGMTIHSYEVNYLQCFNERLYIVLNAKVLRITKPNTSTQNLCRRLRELI
jgi:hypothetical protein